MKRNTVLLFLLALTLGCNKYEEQEYSFPERNLNADVYTNSSTEELPLNMNLDQTLAAPAINGGIKFYVCGNGTACGTGWKTGVDVGNTRTKAANKLTPFKTIDYALRQALPGDLIVVGSGVYNTASTMSSTNVYITKSGTSTKRISIQSEKKWGAIIDAMGRNNAINVKCDTDATSPVSYVRIDGFTIRNAAHFGVLVKDARSSNGYTRCSNLEFTNLKIYDIRGYAGLDLQSTKSSLIANNLIYSIGSLEGNSTRNHDHGIYISSNTEDLLIKNNVIYGCKYGWPIHIYYADSPMPAKYHKIINNTLVADNPARKGGIVMSGPGHVIRNNLIYQRNTAANGYKGAIADNSRQSFSGTIIQNNITNLTPLCQNGCRSASISGNLAGTSLNNEFISNLGNNFRLIAGAKSIDKGTLSNFGSRSGAAKEDFDNKPRYSGKAPDVGAFER